MSYAFPPYFIALNIFSFYSYFQEHSLIPLTDKYPLILFLMPCYPCPKPSCIISPGRSFWSIVCPSTLEQLVNRYWLINYEDDCHCQLYWIFSYVNLEGNQSWILIGKTDAEAEVPVFWSSDVSRQLTGKVPDAGKIEGRRRRGHQRMRWLFASGNQNTGTSASASVLPMNVQDWFPLELTGLIFLQSKGLSRVFSNTTVQRHQFFGV